MVLEEKQIPVRDILNRDYFYIHEVKPDDRYSDLIQDLDLGEIEAIILAELLGADYLLMDEKKGRSVATERNIKVVGTLGILLEARKRGYISDVKQKMDKLLGIGFWISEGLYELVLKAEEKLK
ncbi:MAG: DUF3368 domain-containing protein [Bacteroidia bacterium]